VYGWAEACLPELPPPDSTLSLPPKNPFVPQNLALKALPAWLLSTVTKYNVRKNQILLSYKDEVEKWHVVDQPLSQLTASSLSRGLKRVVGKVTNEPNATIETGAPCCMVKERKLTSFMSRRVWNG
jgi:secreted Zn-dependent insulinase-like peptidase